MKRGNNIFVESFEDYSKAMLISNRFFGENGDPISVASVYQAQGMLCRKTSQISRSVFYYRKFIDKYEELAPEEQMFIGGEDIGEVKMFIEKNEGEAGGG